MGDVAVKREGRRGGAVVEAAFLMPWLAFLFVGVLDFGFYSYAGICLQSAVRSAAIAASDAASANLGSPVATVNPIVNAAACVGALGELKGLPNVTNTILANQLCNALPVVVQGVELTCTTTPPCADCFVGGPNNNCSPPATAENPLSVQVAVTYQTFQMVPIPGILMGRMTLTRVSQMRVLH